MNKKEKIVVFVRGGVVQEIRASIKELDFEIVDYDDLECEKSEDQSENDFNDLYKIY